MKTICLTLALFMIATGSFAQSTNTAEVEVALKEFIAENAVSSYNFFSDRLTPDFRYINPKGSISSRADVLKNNEANKDKGTKSEFSDLKIFRSGDLAVVSGIHDFSGYRTGFTYTLEKQKGNGGASRWMFAASQHTPVQAAGNASTTAMTEANFTNFMKAWEKAPTATFEQTTAPEFLFTGHDGTLYDREKLLQLIRDVQYSSLQVDNLKIRSFGNTAVATGTLTSNYAESTPLYSSMKDAFTYVFQNQGGNWKIHSMSHAKLDYKTKKQ